MIKTLHLRKFCLTFMALLMCVVANADSVKEKVVYVTDFSEWAAASAAASKVVSKTTSDKQTLSFTLVKTTVDPTGTNAKFSSPATTGYLKAEKNSSSTVTTSALASVTKVTFVHCATGNNRGWGLKVKGDGDSDWVLVCDSVANPAGGDQVTVTVNRTNCQLQFYNLVDAQNAFMTNLEIKGNVTVSGAERTISAQCSPAEGGTVTLTPNATTYNDGDEVT